ncbi:hypothetical protein GCM10010518_04900 [Kitasatospora cinereorecta]
MRSDGGAPREVPAPELRMELAVAGTSAVESVSDGLDFPRKTLGWKTPAEAFNEQLQLLQQAGVATTG